MWCSLVFGVCGAGCFWCVCVWCSLFLECVVQFVFCDVCVCVVQFVFGVCGVVCFWSVWCSLLLECVG